MKHKEIFEKAYNKLIELYGNMPDVKIVNRFCQEKMFLQETKFFLRYLELFGRIRAKSEALGEHIWVRGAAASSFIAYLLGAVDVNPLSPHIVCPVCKRFDYLAKNVLPVGEGRECCGKKMLMDGFDLPFELYIDDVMKECTDIWVSTHFFAEVKVMIQEEFLDQAVVTLSGEESISWNKFYILDKRFHQNFDGSLKENAKLFFGMPYINLLPNYALDEYHQIEVETGVKMKDAYNEDMMDVFENFMNGNVEGLVNIDTKFLKELIEITKPKNYEEILKLIGFSCADNLWKDNAYKLFAKHRLSLLEIPAYREDVYDLVCRLQQERGIFETGLALAVANDLKPRKQEKGYFIKYPLYDLLNLGIPIDYLFVLDNCTYMFPRSHGVSYLKDSIALMWYKLHYPEEFAKIFLKKE